MKEIKQAVILAGGQGTRLRPLTLKTPKPMIQFHGKPFLEYLLKDIKRAGIKEVLLLTGYLHEQIEEYFKDGKKFGVSISYSYSPEIDDTGTRLRKAKKLIDNEFLLLYSDNYWPLQLKSLYSFYKKKKTDGAVGVYRNFDHYTKNNMRVSEKGLVELYDKTHKNQKLNGVDIGYFILKKKIVDMISHNNSSFELTVLPKLIKKKQLAGFLTHHKYYGLSNLDRIAAIKDFFTPKKVVFLDRDGLINKKAPPAQYVTAWKEFVFLPHIKKALQLLQKKGYIIIIATNQAGVSRGMVTEKNLNIIHKNLITEFKKIGVEIKDIFVCPHGWDEGCFCRKPNPGMLFQAAQKYNLNLFESYCIGDDERDIIAGQSAGCKTYLASSKMNLYKIVKKYL